jgi:hypothetical protein
MREVGKDNKRLAVGATHRTTQFAHNWPYVPLIYSRHFCRRVGSDLGIGTNLYHLRERNLNLDSAFVIHFLELLHPGAKACANRILDRS